MSALKLDMFQTQSERAAIQSGFLFYLSVLKHFLPGRTQNPAGLRPIGLDLDTPAAEGVAQVQKPATLGALGGRLTHAISLAVKMRGSRNIFTGTVRMRTKGKASEAWVDMTAHRAAKHTSWMQVNMCIRSVRTCKSSVSSVSQTPGPIVVIATVSRVLIPCVRRCGQGDTLEA